jgi:hypothetical protein
MQTVEPLPATLDGDQVAALFRVHYRTVQKWVLQGRFPRPDGPGKKPIWAATTILRLLGAVAAEGGAGAEKETKKVAEKAAALTG